jgi:hypothetical protein
MTTTVKGTFEVTLLPRELALSHEQPGLGRMSIDKQFHGELEATSKGEMLSAMTAVKGSAGYVAIERVSGTLQGKKGTFILQHSATIHRGVSRLAIVVVPDSGTEDLAGLHGTMNIEIVGKDHFYVFEFSVPA